jgi:ethanolamine transporter
MCITSILTAILYGIVEGITEWLPISSTGHLIILEKLVPLGLDDRFRVLFDVVIQLFAVLAVITVGLGAAIVERLTGFVLIPGMEPIETGFATVGEIAIVLAGAFPFVYAITKVLRKPLMGLGRLLRVNETAVAGLVASLANSIATFGLLKDMDDRGKIVNIAFAVSAAFVFGDHLGFAAGFAPGMLLPMIVGKLTAGICAVVVALLLTREKR